MSDKASSLTASETTLADYLASKLMGSSLQVSQISKTEMTINADEIITISIWIRPRKKIEHTVFSKLVNRPITVEEINGSEFMEARFEAELEKENKRGIEQDVLLSLDLVREWAKENGYSFT